MLKVYMSVIAQKTAWLFKAPVTIGPNNISITGSWESVPSLTTNELRLSPLYTAHVRILNWKQQLRGRIVEMCADWTVHDNKTFFVHLRVFSNSSVTMEDIDLVSDSVRNALQQHPFIYHVQKLFQQEQPGEATESGC